MDENQPLDLDRILALRQGWFSRGLWNNTFNGMTE